MRIEELKRIYRRSCAYLKTAEANLGAEKIKVCVQTCRPPDYSVRNTVISGVTLTQAQTDYHYHKYTKECIENYINNIKDDDMRFIMRQKLFYNKTNQNIAMQLGYKDETVIRTRIKKFLEKNRKNRFRRVII